MPSSSLPKINDSEPDRIPEKRSSSITCIQQVLRSSRLPASLRLTVGVVEEFAPWASLVADTLADDSNPATRCWPFVRRHHAEALRAGNQRIPDPPPPGWTYGRQSLGSSVMGTLSQSDRSADPESNTALWLPPARVAPKCSGFVDRHAGRQSARVGCPANARRGPVCFASSTSRWRQSVRSTRPPNAADANQLGSFYHADRC